MSWSRSHLVEMPPAGQLLPVALTLLVTTLYLVVGLTFLDYRALAIALVLVFAVCGVLVLARTDCLRPGELTLAALVSANYNVFFNASAFVEGGVGLGRLITPAAVAGLVLFLAYEYAQQRHGTRFQPRRVDWLVLAVFAAATGAFAFGLFRANPTVWVVGDYGQLLYMLVAYAVVRLRYARLGAEPLRTFLVLLAISWGARAAAELLIPDLRGTPDFHLEGGIIVPRRTDPLGPIGIPIIVGLLITEKRPARLWLLAAALLLVVLQNLLGFTRTYYLTLALSAPLLLMYGFSSDSTRGRSLGLGMAGIIGVMGLFVLSGVARDLAADAYAYFTSISDANTPSRIHREAETRIVLGLVEASPLFGHGLGLEYVGVRPGSLLPFETHFIHNSYLALWARGGLLLMLGWIAMILAVLRALLGSGPSALRLGAAVATGILATSVSALAAESMFSYVLGPVLGVALSVGPLFQDLSADDPNGTRSPSRLARPAVRPGVVRRIRRA